MINTKNENQDGSILAEVFEKTNSEKLKYFQSYSVGHPVLRQTYDKLWRAVTDPKPGSIVLVYGPAGVGKTTLLDYLEKKTIERLKSELEIDCEMIPLVKVEAKSPDSGSFNWKTLFRSILRELGEPGIDRKLDLGMWKGSLDSYRVLNGKENPSGDKLREIVEEALKTRRPKAVLIDEAQHIASLTSGRKLYDQQNTIKSIANATQTTHVLFGSYDLLTFRDLNGQLARRTIDLHFRRYRHDDVNDVKAFKNVLRQFQMHIPLRETHDLVNDWQYMYERSAGCIGVLKEWLNRAVSMALDQNCKSLNKDHLDSSALSVSKGMLLLDEAETGEDKLEDDEEKEDELKNRLWSSDYIKVKKPDGEVKKVPFAGKSRKPGIRNPSRDAVGNRRYA